MDWGQVSAIFSAMAAAGAFVTSYVTYVQADRQRKIDIMPFLALSRGKGIRKSCSCLLDPERPVPESRRLDFERYPAYLYFTNLGKGPARLLVVDLDTKDIVCHIGTPLSIGPGSTACLKVWLPEHEVNYSVKLALYYWSIESHCFSTQVRVSLLHQPTFDEVSGQEVGARLEWRVDSEKTVAIEGLKEPSGVVQWPRGSLFYRFLI